LIKGLIEPYGGKFNLEALLMCILDEDQALLAFDYAVQYLEKAW
jgi:hypothetical protein